MDFISNPQLELAFDYVRNTNKNIFLTGKAGTGKTTFLHQLKKEGLKRMVIVAPTGVAAINAKGMTIHSFFQLPFGLILPGQSQDRNKQRRFNRKKVSLIQGIDLLVIDEISMVRADLLDGIDEVLRRYKDFTKPFGGVQLLMIGDLHQLPPVVKPNEWDLLREHYSTPYFFGSLALQKTAPICIQLKHIYRQSDRVFIDLLNKVRDNAMDESVLKTLNSRYIPDFKPNEKEGYIILTSHNAAAQKINDEKLDELKETVHLFKAQIKGEFPAHAFPTGDQLSFKLGAQVMFVKNDPSPEKLFYNGKIGKITKIDDDAIYVLCPDEEEEIAVIQAEWENTRYNLNKKTKEVSEEIIGSFTQYPLKLAWAITIHKSQGLTFEKAIIDAKSAFAHGQVYVALSRCKSFEGIVLKTPIAFSSVKTDRVVQQYSSEAARNAPDQNHLFESKRAYQQALLFDLFNFKIIQYATQQLKRFFLEQEKSFHGNPLDVLNKWEIETKAQIYTIAQKFIPHLRNYFLNQQLPEEQEELQERIKKASQYFSEKIQASQEPLNSFPILTDNTSYKKDAKEKLEKLKKEIFIKKCCFEKNQKGFTAQAYIRIKNDAAIEYSAKKSSKGSLSNSFIPKDTPHPNLFFELIQWRRDVAADNGVELYNVLPAKSLLELVKYLPTNSASLKKIKGIGDYKVKLFGNEIIEKIQNYCKEKKIVTDLLSDIEAPPVKPKKKKVNTKLISFELFKSGNNIAAIAKERGLTSGTIENHLAYFIEKGELDIFKIMERDSVDEIASFFTEKQSTSSSEAKAFFEEKYSYSDIKMVLSYLRQDSN